MDTINKENSRQMSLRNIVEAIRQAKEINGMQIEKEEIK
jgi:hypothetical protein